MSLSQAYKFDLECSPMDRLSEFIERNNLSVFPLNTDTEETMKILVSTIESLQATITKEELNSADQNLILENLINIDNIIFNYIIISNDTVVNDFFSEFDNDKLLFSTIEKVQGDAPTLAAFMTFFLFYRLQLIRESKTFSELFLKHFFETEIIEKENVDKHRCFENSIENLILIDELDFQIFSKEFLEHLSKVIKANAKNGDSMIPFIYFYFRIVQNYVDNDFGENVAEDHFYDFLEEYITSLDINQKGMQYSFLRLLINVKEFDFFEWFFKEKYIEKVTIQLIENTKNDNYLFLLSLFLLRMKNQLVYKIKDPIYKIILSKCEFLIEKREWSSNENIMAKKIIRSLHFLIRLKHIDTDKSYENKMTILAFLSNLYDKSIYAIKDKTLLFVSVFIQNFCTSEITRDSMNLFASIFIKCIDLDSTENRFFVLSGYWCLFQKMQATELYDEFRNTFIENNVIEYLKDAINTQCFNDDDYALSNKIIAFLLEGKEVDDDDDEQF